MILRRARNCSRPIFLLIWRNNEQKKAAQAMKKLLKKLKCPKYWKQKGGLSANNSMATPFHTVSVGSTFKCGALCRKSAKCKVYSYSAATKACSLHEGISDQTSVDNQVMCQRTMKKVKSRPKREKRVKRARKDKKDKKNKEGKKGKKEKKKKEKKEKKDK